MSLFDDASLVLTPNGYKASKLYSIKPTSGAGDMVVSRNTTATRVNSAGLLETVAINVPRLDYTGGGCPKILVEPARTNLLTYSNDFTNVAWSKDRVTISANSIISPDGTLNASKLNDTLQGNNAYRLYNSLTLSSQSYTQTFYAKAAEYNWVYVRIGNAQRAWFNISNGTLGTINIGLSGSIISVGNGWYKITTTITTATAGGGFALIGLTNANNIESYTPITGGQGIYIYGTQLEASSNATSYIPTTTLIAGTTRVADVISKTGISSLIGQTEGTIYAEINNTLMTSYSTGYVIRIFADANNEVWIRKEGSSNTYTARWRANSTNVVNQLNIPVLNGNNKIAIAYKSTDSAVYLNGTQIGTSASTGAFSVAPSQIAIGSNSAAEFFNDRIELATLFQTRLTNAQLATLTTL